MKKVTLYVDVLVLPDLGSCFCTALRRRFIIIFFTMKYRERIPNRRRGFSFHVNNDLLSSCYLGGLFEGTLPSLTKELNVYTFLFTQTVHSTGTLPIRERDQSYLSIYLFKKMIACPKVRPRLARVLDLQSSSFRGKT